MKGTGMTDAIKARDIDARSALLRGDWTHIQKTTLDEFVAEDWMALDRQRAAYMREQRAEQALEMLAASATAPSFGYLINNFMHCLQTATMMLRRDHDEEDVVVGLFHDIGFVVCNENHGAFAAALLRPYCSDRNLWMLERHAIFQSYHVHEYPGCDSHERERWRGHPHFEWTAEFVERYDQRAIDPHREILPLEAFAPIVRRFFAREPRLCGVT